MVQIGDKDALEYFPLDEFRPGQRECVELIRKHFNAGKKYVVLEAPTGSGKSAIGISIANMFQTSYYITIQKVLQDQIYADFGDNVNHVMLKGRSNYPCTYWSEQGAKMLQRGVIRPDELKVITDNPPHCADGKCRRNNEPWDGLCMPTRVNGGQLHQLPHGMLHSACPYFEQVGRLTNSRIANMNFSSFLHLRRKFTGRDLLIVDEAHNIEPHLLDYVTVELSDYYLRPHGIKLPSLETARDYVEWIENDKVVSAIEIRHSDAINRKDTRDMDLYRGILDRLAYFLYSVSRKDWVVKYERGDKSNRLTLKPVWVDSEATTLMMSRGERVLMMSATILDSNRFLDGLGIDQDKAAVVRIGNRFHPDRRPVYVMGTAKCTGGTLKMNDWMPQITGMVDRILDARPNVRGIIHTHNYKITQWLLDNCQNKDRLVSQTQFHYNGREEALAALQASSNKVLVAPAMHEGVDLKDDLSRLQIVCKIPWASFYDDPQLKARMDIDRGYYVWLTALKFVQSLGRSVRNERDWAETFVLDDGFESFYRQAQNMGMIPRWVDDSIRYHSGIDLPRNLVSTIEELDGGLPPGSAQPPSMAAIKINLDDLPF